MRLVPEHRLQAGHRTGACPRLSVFVRLVHQCVGVEHRDARDVVAGRFVVVAPMSASPLVFERCADVAVPLQRASNSICERRRRYCLGESLNEENLRRMGQTTDDRLQKSAMSSTVSTL